MILVPRSLDLNCKTQDFISDGRKYEYLQKRVGDKKIHSCSFFVWDKLFLHMEIYRIIDNGIIQDYWADYCLHQEIIQNKNTDSETNLSCQAVLYPIYSLLEINSNVAVYEL